MPPSSARKSSLGISTRQKALEPHRPYRGDNPEVGKKTGIAVRHVERKSDGFEPFDQILKQADVRTPPNVKGAVKKKRKVSVPAIRYSPEYDIDGELSMDIASPLPTRMSQVRPVISPRAPRQSTISRPISRNSHVDFDEVPSPRPARTPRKSVAASQANTSTPRSNYASTRNAGPSTLSHVVTARDEEDSESDNEPAGDYDYGGGGADYGDGGDDDEMGGYGDPEEDQDQEDTPRRRSFAEMDVDQGDEQEEEQEEDQEEEQEEEEEEEEEASPPPVSVKSAKGNKATSTAQPKSRQQQRLETIPEPEHESDEEDDVQRQIEHSQEEEEEEDREPTPKPKSKKVKVIEKKGPRTLSVGSRNKKENKPVREGVRRSAREPYKPLEWWRGEKLVYGKPSAGTHSGPILVPHIVEILRIPKEDPKPLGKRKRGGYTRPRSKSRTTDDKTVEEAMEAAKAAMNPEEGWDDETDVIGSVVDYETHEKLTRKIAFTEKMIQVKKIAGADWLFQKVFGEEDFIAAGQLLIPPYVRKPSKGSKDNTYIFYVIQGAINLIVGDTSMILCTGSMFMVPRGNTYFIENICERDVKLFFTQGRKVPMEAIEARGSSIAPISVLRQGSNVVQALPAQKAPPASTRAVTEGPLKKEKERAGAGGERSGQKEGGGGGAGKGKRANSSRI